MTMAKNSKTLGEVIAQAQSWYSSLQRGLELL